MTVLCILFSLLFFVSHACASTVTRIQGTEVTWYTAGASLASNGQVQSGTVALGANAGHLGAYCNLAFSTTTTGPTAGTAIVGWFRVSTDGGTTFPDGGASVTPAEPPNLTFPVRAVTGNQVVSARIADGTMPVGVFQVLFRNDATGATLNSGFTLKCKTHTLSIN